MHRFNILFGLCFFACVCNSQGISFFEGSWEQALNEAQKEDKIIFVDAYAKWCGPCKRMAMNVFTQDQVGDFFNSNFINLKMDMEETKGIKFGRKYPVGAFPTLFFLDSEGNVLKKVVGGKQADDLLSLASIAIKSYDKSDQYAERYEAGDRDFDLMLSYVKELNKVDKPSLKISNEYLNSNPEISKKQKAEFLLAAVLESDSKLFDQLMQLKQEAIKVSSKEEFEDCISAACLKTIEKAVEYEYAELMDEAITQFKDSKVGDSKQFEMEGRLYYHALMGEFNLWKDISKKFLKKYGKKNPDIYKEHLSQINKHFNYLSEPITYTYEISELLIKHQATAENYMFYLRKLMNDSRNTKALKISKEAVKKFKGHAFHKQFEQLLNYLEKMDTD